MRLNKAVTFVFAPFYWNTNLDCRDVNPSLYPDKEVWEYADIPVEKDMLYPQIREFLFASITRSGERLNPHDFRIYNVKKEAGARAIFNKELYILSDKKKIPFKLLDKGSLFSPKLVLSPLVSVGFVIIPVKIEGSEVTIEELMLINNKLHKSHSQLEKIYFYDDCRFSEQIVTDCNQLSKKEESGKLNEEIIFKRINSNINKLRSFRKEITEIFSLENQDKLDITLSGGKPDINQILDSVQSLKEIEVNIDRILELFSPKITLVHKTGIESVETSRFNRSRLHLFTYLEANDSDDSPELRENFARIIHCQNSNYKGADINSNLYLKSFENIYMGISIEGSAMMTLYPDKPVEDTGNNEENLGKMRRDGSTTPLQIFIREYLTSSFPRYFWIYVMVLMQRYSLMQMIRRLTSVDDYISGNKQRSLKRLRRFVKNLSEMKVNTFFSDISDHTQHNFFYSLALEKLRVMQYYQEIEQKMDSLNDYLEQLEGERKEKMENEMAIALAIIAVPSATNDLMDMLSKFFPAESEVQFESSYIGLPVLFGLIAYFIIRHFIRKFR